MNLSESVHTVGLFRRAGSALMALMIKSSQLYSCPDMPSSFASSLPIKALAITEIIAGAAFM
eukprot:scaffold147504_cov22-Tisochrysis_lutea.AAC.1